MSSTSISAITLSKAVSPSEADRFAETIWKFHMRCQHPGRIRHVIVDASEPHLGNRIAQLVEPLRDCAEILLERTRGSWALDFNHAFSLIETDYAVLFLPDHVLEPQKDDFLSDCAMALEANHDVYQIHLAGPYTEWTVERRLLKDPGFKTYVNNHNPFRVPFYPWLRIDEDHLWYGGRMLYNQGLPSPGNPLERRVVARDRVTLWVSPPQPPGSPIRSQAPFIAGGGTKHLALGFNGAPAFYSMQLFRPYLPIPDRGLPPAEASELYFYRHTDLDQRYGIGWLNAQTFFWHWDYGWGLTTEPERALFRELLMNHKQL